jgi:hypothetical protein
MRKKPVNHQNNYVIKTVKDKKLTKMMKMTTGIIVAFVATA